MHFSRTALHLSFLALAACSGGPSPSCEELGDDHCASSAETNETAPPPATDGWVVRHAEDFEGTQPLEAAWSPDPVPDDGPFSDAGAWFQAIAPPRAFRASTPFSASGWLTAESYTRSSTTPFSALAAVVPDPAGGSNRVLRVRSQEHTDGTVIRSTEPLPSRYRISLRVGYADFGDGKPGLNGYDGGETAEPWSGDSAVSQNGFYWLTILDAQPRPHNNTWIHHHRKVVIDSDNHYPAWMEIHDGRSFISSGERPVMMFALDGKAVGDERTGKPFLSWSAGQWQPSGKIRAVDAYVPGEWYRVSIERFDSHFTLEVSGRFKYGGQTTYRAAIDAAARCVWHFNRGPGDDASACVDPRSLPSLGPEFPNWPPGGAWPDWFMFGDPHTNYYEGEVFYDDVRLEVWNGG